MNIVVIMAIKKNGGCIYTYFEKEILCAGAMDEYVTIKERALQGTTFDSIESEELFTDVGNIFGKLEVRNPTKRYDGVTIPDSVTHIVYIPFDQTYYELDMNKAFIEIDRSRKRYFKMLSVKNVGEQDEYIAFFCKETGFSDLKAATG